MFSVFTEVDFRCCLHSVYSMLLLQVTWFFGDHVFTRSYSEPKDRVVFPNGSLKIVLVQMDDSGMYRCVYERDGLSTASHAELTVAQGCLILIRV